MTSELLQIAVVVVAAGAALVLVARSMLAKAGFRRPGGKPDCGCGRCDEKKGERTR
jgi:hypothetical protein